MTTRTPGPWHNQGNYVYSKKNIAMVARCPDNKPIEQAIADAEFIAGCENENNRLRIDIERLVNILSNLHTLYSHNWDEWIEDQVAEELTKHDKDGD